MHEGIIICIIALKGMVKQIRNAAYIVCVERYTKIAIDLMVLFSIQNSNVANRNDLETWNLELIIIYVLSFTFIALFVRLFCHFTRTSYAGISTLTGMENA